MNLSRNARIALLVVILAVFAISLERIFPLDFGSSGSNNPTPIIAGNAVFNGQAKNDFGIPVRLKIPAINVDSAFEYVGLTPEGAMDVPKSPSNVAWYELGPRPGEKGNAVIAGHYGWKDGKPAVFDDLYKLQKGDKIFVEDEKGTITTFIVRESRRYDSEADASDVFTSKDGKAHLVLITCEGAWNKTQRSYSKRLVVFADMEREQ